MITDMASYLRFFDSVRRRTERDVAALPPQAAAWRPPVVNGETGWSIGDIVSHIGGSRLYFASAYRGEGWIFPPESDRADQRTWLPWLQTSAERFVALLRDTPETWLTRRIEMIDTAGSLSGWRLLMMMVEHEVHHRSQIDTYAGLEGWPVPHIFERSFEAVAALQSAERARHHAQG
ncbi:MAG: DinB family protein [Candidatus Rokuibacteriota bacterium]